MTTYENIGVALADPNSNIARVMRAAHEVADERKQFFADWQAEGSTVEDCWTRYLAIQRELVYG